MALSFAASGAKLVLIGLTESNLLKTKALLPSTTECKIYPCDITDAAGMSRIASEVGSWDVFVQNAGVHATPGPIASTSLADIDRVWNVNVRSLYITAKEFLPTAREGFASLLVVTSSAAQFQEQLPDIAAYADSKVAQAKIAETLAAQYPGVSVVSFHPGGIVTDGFCEAGLTIESVPTYEREYPALVLKHLESLWSMGLTCCW